MTAELLILTLGGTIASTATPTGARPTRSGAALIEDVPDLEAVGSPTVVEVARKPSTELTFEDLERVREEIVEATAADPEARIVVVQGTDTMEETAFYLDLVIDHRALGRPIVLTGAQRRPDELGNDGPRNLLDAATFATDERLAGHGGVYVAFDETLHAAADVRKTHASRLNAFTSPNVGPIAEQTRGGVRLRGEPGSRTGSLPPTPVSTAVEVVDAGLGADGSSVRRAVDAGIDGLVLEATGLGNAPKALGDALGEAIEGGTVVAVASRCPAGEVEPVYGAGGGGRRLVEDGALFAGSLSAHKARIALLLATSAGADPEERSALARRGLATGRPSAAGDPP